MYKHAVILVLAALLSGCTALLVGGAAVGGYHVGKDERTAGEIADDGAITTAVTARLVRDELVLARDVEVNTFRKVVTLRGSVPSDEAWERAVELASGVDNVENVEAGELKIQQE